MIFGVYIFLLLELLVVTYFDLKTKKISNYWSILNLGFFVILLLLFPHAYDLTWATFKIPVIFFSVGYVLFVFKIMGAGDVKYLTSCLLLTPNSEHLMLISYLVYTTIFVGAGILLMRRLTRNKMPYAPVVLASYIWFGIENF